MQSPALTGSQDFASRLNWQINKLAQRARQATQPGASALAQFQAASADVGTGDWQKAIPALVAVLEKCAGFPAAWIMLGLAAGQAGLAVAELESHRQAVRLAPDFAQAQLCLASTLTRLGQHEDAIVAGLAAVTQRPGLGVTWRELATNLRAVGRTTDALAAVDAAIETMPQDTESCFLRAGVLQQLVRLPQAAEAYDAFLRLKPDSVAGWCNRGVVLQDMGQVDAALESYQRALAIQPDHPDTLRNLGTLLHMIGAFEEAAQLYQVALQRSPDDAELTGYLGAVHTDLGQLEKAEDFFQKALNLAPDSADIHFNYSLALLKAGKWPRGWQEHEWRWRGPMPPHGITKPQWLGESLNGQRVLLHAEQGLGDTLHFARYVALVAAAGGQVVLEVQPPLVNLLSRLPGVTQVVPWGQVRPEFDRHAPLMSLPLAAGSDQWLSSPYLHADTQKRLHWQTRLDALAPGARVGLVWAGSPRPNEVRSHYTDRRRSVPLAEWAPLSRVQGINWISLQIGPAAAHINDFGAPMIDWTSEIKDFSDTADLVAALDLVIAVDTSVAHLAGALGTQIWMLSRFDGCWRWGVSGKETPWYPSMRIYRQARPGEWGSVMREVAQDLAREYGRGSTDVV